MDDSELERTKGGVKRKTKVAGFFVNVVRHQAPHSQGVDEVTMDCCMSVAEGAFLCYHVS